MQKQEQRRRKRLTELACRVGFDSYPLNDITDKEELEALEATLEDLEQLQKDLRSLN